MKKNITLLLLFVASVSIAREVPPLIKTFGVRIGVPDMAVALGFYVDKLGFKVTSATTGPVVELSAGDNTPLFLVLDKQAQASANNEVKSKMTLQVNDLDKAVERARELGISFAETDARKEAIGRAISITDPFGTVISLMHVTVRQTPEFPEPRIYNYGFMTNSMEASRNFYCTTLGFPVYSEKYLPLDLPLSNPDKTFGFMLHFRDWIIPGENAHASVAIVFQCNDLETARQYFLANKIVFKENTTWPGKAITFVDPTGVVSELVERK